MLFTRMSLSSGTKRRPLDSVVSVRCKVRTFVEENEQEKLGWCGIYYCIFFLIYFISFLYVYKFTLFVSPSYLFSIYKLVIIIIIIIKTRNLLIHFFLLAIRRPQSVSTCNCFQCQIAFITGVERSWEKPLYVFQFILSKGSL